MCSAPGRCNDVVTIMCLARGGELWLYCHGSRLGARSVGKGEAGCLPGMLMLPTRVYHSPCPDWVAMDTGVGGRVYFFFFSFFSRSGLSSPFAPAPERGEEKNNNRTSRWGKGGREGALTVGSREAKRQWCAF